MLTFADVPSTCDMQGGLVTVQKTKCVDINALITAITVNSKFTSNEATDLIHLLTAVIQFALAEQVPVELADVGLLDVDKNKNVSFRPAESLVNVVRQREIRIESKHGLTNTDLSMLGEWIYKHRVPVC